MGSKVVVLVGQIASGKTTLAKYLEQTGFERIVTYTTRPPRDGEIDGRDYHFIPEGDFKEKQSAGFFAEFTQYDAAFGHVCYGTGKESLKAPGGVNKVLVLNPDGVFALKEARYDIFVMHLDFDQETLMRRALKRGDTPVEIGRRVAADSLAFDILRCSGYADLTVDDPKLSTEQIAEKLLAALRYAKP